jgi:hypothetical protein
MTRHAQTDEASADARLTALLDAAGAPAEPGPAPGEEATLAAFRASCVRTDGWRSRMHAKTPLKTLGVTAASAGLLLTGGFAAAAAGALPGAAQDPASDMLASLEIDVPGPNEHSDGHADTRGQSEAPPHTGNETHGPGTLPEAAAFGQTIADLARNTALTGAEKGKAISEAARTNGQAGEHTPPTVPEHAKAQDSDTGAPGAAAAQADQDGQGAGGRSEGRAPVETPNEGGTTTADGATADADGGTPSSRGTATAGEKSGGRSAAGSGNAP